MTLTTEEAKALFDVVNDLSGHNPENVFQGGGKDDPADPWVRAFVKLYEAAGRHYLVPEHLRSKA